jgi:hypothetical protein
MEVHAAQPVLVAIFREARAGINHENTLAGVGVFFVNDNEAGRDAGAVKQISGQADDALDVALAYQVAANVSLGIATEQHAVRQNARALAVTLERAHEVQQISVIALLGRRRTEAIEPFVWIIERVNASAPALVAEGRIGDDIIESLGV